jgi:L-ascorbate metabolism protein UlaG (beta-lactamase superfamily)
VALGLWFGQFHQAQARCAEAMKTQRPQIILCLGLLGGLIWVGWLNAQTPPQFTGLQPLTNKEIRLTLTAPVGRSYRIEATTNAQDWSGLFTFPTNVATSLQHTDSAAPYLPARFYRAAQLSGTNILSGDHLATTNGDVVFRPVDHASFVMQWNDKFIYNDPAGGSFAGIPKADLILISHTHGDHFNATVLAGVWKTNTIFIAPQAVYNSMAGSFRSNTIVLANGAATNVLGLNVAAVPAYNGNHPLGNGNGYVLTIGGKRIYISGDTGNQPEIRALANIDVAFLCINLPFTMSVSDATNCVRAFRPQVVYPYHYRNQGGDTTNAAAFKQRLGTDLGIEVRLRKWY